MYSIRQPRREASFVFTATTLSATSVELHGDTDSDVRPYQASKRGKQYSLSSYTKRKMLSLHLWHVLVAGLAWAQCCLAIAPPPTVRPRFFCPVSFGSVAR